MTQKNQQLLLKDLYARLPYGIKVVYLATTYNIQYVDSKFDEVKLEGMPYTVGICHIKPYLRPMSSMTEEEFVEFRNTWEVLEHRPDVTALSTESYDWLNANHFDYRKLIEKGLALEATKDIYLTK